MKVNFMKEIKNSRFLKWLDKPSNNPMIHEFIQKPVILIIASILIALVTGLER